MDVHCVIKCPKTEFFWSVVSCIRTEYRKIQTRNNSVFGHFSCSGVYSLQNQWEDSSKQGNYRSRSSHPEMFQTRIVGFGHRIWSPVLRRKKISRKFTGEHPYGSVISIKLLCNFIGITLWHEWSPVNLLHIFRTPLSKTPLGTFLVLSCNSQLFSQEMHRI